MVNKLVFINHRGLRDWLIQRISSIVLGLYSVFLLFYFVTSPSPSNFADWQMLFNNSFVRMFSILAVMSVVMHAWVGLWTVFTDYIKVISLRFVLQVLLVILLFFYFVWAMEILWGI